MLRTVTGRIVTFSVFLILSVGVTFYIHEKNKPAPEPIKIYKTTTPYSNRATAAKSQSVKAVPTEVPPVEDPHAGHNHPPQDQSHDAETLPTETPSWIPQTIPRQHLKIHHFQMRKLKNG
ncbi:hypothetical protein F4054_16000 [Candidatus Poribacteria bacterium]|nr:hypothetical protein [Candidatus Poribacteria bacterium]MYK23746.1 hypothetical protein [Candidatus Poribacteria bacterium]